MYSILRGKNEGIEDAVLHFARELVRTPSPSLAEAHVAKLVEKEMREIGYDRVIRDDYGNVVGIIHGGEGQPTLLLNSHMDTVSRTADASARDGVWSDGRLYGVGASDCKGGLAAQVFCGLLLKRSLLPLRGNLVVAATVAEENGLSVGVRALLDETLPSLGISPDYAVLGEPTNLGLYYGHDGRLEMEIHVRGIDPFLVDDAARAIIRDFESAHAAREAEAPALFDVEGPRFETVGGIRTATISMARRLGPLENARDVVRGVSHDLSLVSPRAAAVAVDVAPREETQRLYNGKTTVVRHVTNGWSTDPFHPLIDRARQSFAAAGCPFRPGRWELSRIGMGTAGHVLVGEFDVPTIGYGPGRESLAHRPGEYVELAAIPKAVYGTAVIAHSLIGIPVCGWTSDEI